MPRVRPAPRRQRGGREAGRRGAADRDAARPRRRHDRLPAPPTGQLPRRPPAGRRPPLRSQQPLQNRPQPPLAQLPARPPLSRLRVAHQFPHGDEPTGLDAAQAGGVLHHQRRVAEPVPRRQAGLAQLRPGPVRNRARQQRRRRVAQPQQISNRTACREHLGIGQGSELGTGPTERSHSGRRPGELHRQVVHSSTQHLTTDIPEEKSCLQALKRPNPQKNTQRIVSHRPSAAPTPRHPTFGVS